MAKTDKQRVGNLGEQLAERFLVKHGYIIVSRNYRKTLGEIDIICKKRKTLYFVEVKTVSRENISGYKLEDYRAEDHIHEAKLKRMGRTIQVYLEEFCIEDDWEIMGVIVLLDETHKKAKIMLLEDLII